MFVYKYIEKKIFKNQSLINEGRNWRDLKVYKTCNKNQLENDIIIENLYNTKSLFLELNLYNDIDCERYIKNKSKFLWEIYNIIENGYGAMKADFFRYIIMYFEGGLYLDIKSGLRKNLFLQLDDDVEMYLSNWVENQHRKGESILN